MEYETEKVRYISHEVKNQLSICDLYTEILERYCDKNGIDDETVRKSIGCMKNALLIAGNSLMELKSSHTQLLEKFRAVDIIEEAYLLSKVYGVTKNVDITFGTELKDEEIYADKSRFQSVIINLVKNACEAFCDEKDKKITISSKRDGNVIKITVSNNAKPIENADIFKEGVTTKETGSGLGLYISRKNMEEMGGELNLKKSDNLSTDFEIMIKVL